MGRKKSRRWAWQLQKVWVVQSVVGCFFNFQFWQIILATQWSDLVSNHKPYLSLDIWYWQPRAWWICWEFTPGCQIRLRIHPMWWWHWLIHVIIPNEHNCIWYQAILYILRVEWSEWLIIEPKDNIWCFFSCIWDNLTGKMSCGSFQCLQTFGWSWN